MKKLAFLHAAFLASSLCFGNRIVDAAAAPPAAPTRAARFVPTRLGVGIGPSTAWKQERAAPSSAIQFDGSKPAYVDVPEVTLNPNGDWSLFLVTRSTNGGYYQTGTVLSIGTPSDMLFTDASHLSITWCAGYFNAWRQGHFANAFVATAKDDAGTSAALRRAADDTFFGLWNVSPLVGQADFADSRVHGLCLQCRNGVVEFWSVDETGARLMDSGAVGAHFKGITGKPLRIGAALLKKQPSDPYTYWKQPVQCLVIDNGGCLSPTQMTRLFGCAHAQDVLSLKAARGDRYYPGTVSNGVLDELVDGKTGTINEGVAAGTSMLSSTVSDDVSVDMDGSGQVLPRENAPAKTSRARFWGTRVGPATDIRMRVVPWSAPIPLPEASKDAGKDAMKPVVDWTTVARGVKNGQTWIGEIPGVPNAFADYDCEVSWKDAKSAWTPARRLHRRWSMGVVAGLAGQSILQKARDDSGPKLGFDPKVAGFLRAYYDPSQGTAGYQDNAQPQGWNNRWTPEKPENNANFGEMRMSETLALLTNSPIGIGNFAVGGSPIATYLGDTDKWSRWKRFTQRNRPQFGVWGNGQGDVGMSREQRFAALDQLLAQYDQAVQTAPGGPWKYTFYIFPLNGDWGLGGNADGIRSYDAEWAMSRAAQGKPTAILCFVLDDSTLDGTHLSDDDAGHGILASRMAQTLAQGIGAARFSGLGPSFDARKSDWSTSNGETTAHLALIQNGGSALVTASGGAPSGFAISGLPGFPVSPIPGNHALALSKRGSLKPLQSS